MVIVVNNDLALLSIWFGLVWFGLVWFGFFGLVWFGSSDASNFDHLICLFHPELREAALHL